jgi:hypothetical protein
MNNKIKLIEFVKSDMHPIIWIKYQLDSECAQYMQFCKTDNDYIYVQYIIENDNSPIQYLYDNGLISEITEYNYKLTKSALLQVL